MKYTMSKYADRRWNTIVLDTAAGTITGDTYQMRDVIKEEFPGCTWDKGGKCWRHADIASRVDEIRDYLVRCYKLEEAPEHTSDAKQSTTRSDLIGKIASKCPRCGTYCYGDCSY